MAKLALILPIKKLKQLAMAEETELIGFEAYGEIVKTIRYMIDLQLNITTDNDRVKEIEELVYSIEDVIQNYGVILRSTSSDNILPLKIFSNRYGSGAARKQAKSEITSLCEKINQLASQKHFYDSKNQQLIPQNDNNFVYKHEVVVGLEEEKEVIIQVLLAKSNDSSNFLAVPIWGPSGTGKTTLANEVYKDVRIFEEFKQHRVKIRVSENINVHYALLHVVELFEGGVDKKYVEMPTISLIKCVSQCLEKSRTLIVLEDVRSIDDWRMLRSALGVKDCRILFTTRVREVAESITQAMYIHQKRPLTDEKSWELLKKIVWPEKDEGISSCCSLFLVLRLFIVLVLFCSCSSIFFFSECYL